jgi:uncharacterized repeat protein (TIGR03803 family)
MPGSISQTATLTTIASLSSSDGIDPSGVVFNAAGDLIGTGNGTGVNGAFGTIFEIVGTNGIFSGTPQVLVSFQGSDGEDPYGGVIIAANGDLLGTTAEGGSSNDGTVYELAPQGGAYAADTTVLASFNNSTTPASNNGDLPETGLTADAKGDLFGTTNGGGAHGAGEVFEITDTGGQYATAPKVIASFAGMTSEYPTNGLLVDASGNIFGTTDIGTDITGEIYEIGSGSSSITTLATFTGTVGTYNPGGAGATPSGTLVEDAKGDLFGVTTYGGTSGYGTVFELIRNGNVYANAPTILVNFNGMNGQAPVGGLLIDAAGNLFGTTSKGGAAQDGTVFEVSNTASGYAGTPLTLASFTGTGGMGATPESALTADAAGDLFATTNYGGANDYGTVFEVTNSGYVTTACYREGTRLATPLGELAVEALRAGDLVITHSGGVRPILWVGHRVIDCRRHSSPADVWPIRIGAGAFGRGLPVRDLFVSPDHAVFAGGVLIPARLLVDGACVVQVPCDEVRYFHVATQTHDVVLAEGLPCETLLDLDRPERFDNAQTAPVRSGWLVPYAPVISQGVRLQRVRELLRAMAGLDA